MGYFSDNYDMTEAEYLDDGGDYVDCEDTYSNGGIDRSRSIRKHRLIGQYVIICDSRHDTGVRYLQDQSISPSFVGHFWTNYIENAKGFTDLSAAVVKCKNLKYNNPRPMLVGRQFELIPVRYSAGSYRRVSSHG